MVQQNRERYWKWTNSDWFSESFPTQMNSGEVSCGNHRAIDCENCPPDHWVAAPWNWCNGDCAWDTTNRVCGSVWGNFHCRAFTRLPHSTVSVLIFVISYHLYIYSICSAKKATSEKWTALSFINYCALCLCNLLPAHSWYLWKQKPEEKSVTLTNWLTTSNQGISQDL